MPNTELGHLELDGNVAEQEASGRLREEEILSWEEWIPRVQRYLNHVESLFWPELIVFGGGISNEAERFMSQFSTRAELVIAQLRNNAGIVGAALMGSREAGASRLD